MLINLINLINFNLEFEFEILRIRVVEPLFFFGGSVPDPFRAPFFHADPIRIHSGSGSGSGSGSFKMTIFFIFIYLFIIYLLITRALAEFTIVFSSFHEYLITHGG